MDINEFEQKMAPKAKRSQLEPFAEQILALKNKGYANWQIREFLAGNGIKITVEGVRKFVKSREGKETARASGSAIPAGVTSKPLVKPGPLGSQKALDAKAVLGDLAKPEGKGNEFSAIPNPSILEIDEQEKEKK